MTSEHASALSELAAKGRLRGLMPRRGVDFSSNDYLGLAASEELAAAAAAALSRGVPVGAGGSRLLRGNHSEHEALESEAAAFFGSEAALYFASGFMANYALYACLPQRGDVVVFDALIHASAHDGMRNGRAERVAVAHNDTNAVEDAIRRWRASGGTGRAWIAVESLYSMDGDYAPIEELAEVADRYEAMLMIDEAHATGVFGPGGRGIGYALEGRQNVVALHTCGKALGAVGALVTCPAVIRDFIVNRGRPFVFATAPSPLMAAVVRDAIRLVESDDERRRRLCALTTETGDLLARHCGITSSGSQIQPVIVGADGDAVALASALQVRGFDVRAVRPPTVPEGSARLRLSITLNAEPHSVRAMVVALGSEIGKLGLTVK